MATAENEYYLHVRVHKSGRSFAPLKQQEGTVEANQSLFLLRQAVYFAFLKQTICPTIATNIWEGAGMLIWGQQQPERERRDGSHCVQFNSDSSK